MFSADGSNQAPLQVAVADDEAPAVAELSYLLAKDPRIGQIHTAQNAAQTLHLLQQHAIDAVFLDIHMPGLNGIELARLLSAQEKGAPGRGQRQPTVIFVTADEDRALEAFDVAAVDYLLKPVRLQRLSEAVRRATEQRTADAGKPGSPGAAPGAVEELISVEQGGVSRLIRRSDVSYVQAQGDYARLHTQDASYLVRIPLSELEEQWREHGFLRIHRSSLISLRHIGQMRWGRGAASVLIDGAELPVSRRYLPAVRERLKAIQVSRAQQERPGLSGARQV
ncbi:LytTR family DNA-binding domain-containing protein [Acaricomes phytoseiuli]|uniref:LytR/AlgR family response regulator transcription factor n=1 Tax=Acaricomes phytoseiuli TaxID=291968 RepID=UPI000686ADF7|nr:LytTR family DNA-binding domain-containing protein [Acaricomes phytoseiuli]MCW1249797.1 LytTR family DNA-binding domain-containing protein [Acaricomes phytoseiuli]